MKLTTKLLKGYRLTSRYTLSPVPELTLPHYILNKLENAPDSVVLLDGLTGAKTTRGQLAEQILRVAGWTKDHVEKGDTVGVSLPNTTAYLGIVLGSIHAGARVTLLNPIYTQSEVEHTCGLTKPKLAFTTPISLDTLKSSANSIQKYVLLGAEVEGCTPFSQVLASDKISEGISPTDLNETALMPYSSGTTGLPKAVCLSHKNVVTYNVMQEHPMYGNLGPGKNMIGLLPMFHVYGFCMTMFCIVRGATYTVLPRFELESFLKAIQTYKITCLPVVPSIASLLAKHPAVMDYDLSSVEEILCASAPLSHGVQKALSERLGTENFRNGYGMSEIVAGSIIPPPSEAAEIMRKGSAGVLMPGVEARIVDIETGEDLGPGQEGEILMKADTLMQGYLGDAGATASTIDEDGWIHSGDIGKYDEHQCFYITDRLKELIKYKGMQVAPAELEDVILRHPAVADVGVIGVPSQDPGAGEEPRAFVVVKPGVETSESLAKEIENLVKDTLSSYKALRGGVRFLEILPRSLAGKLLRRELRKL